MVLKDDSPMPFGAWKGTAMANVPAKHLFWLRDNYFKGKTLTGPAKDVVDYINENEDALSLERKKEEKNK